MQAEAVESPIPVVVLSSDTISSVDALIDRFGSVDDVYSPSFARTVVLQSILDGHSEGLLAQFKASSLLCRLPHISTTRCSSAWSILYLSWQHTSSISLVLR